MRKATQVDVSHWVEDDCNPSAIPADCRGDEREIKCIVPVGKRKAEVVISECNAAHTEYLVTVTIGKLELNAELVTVSRRQLLALPSVIQAGIREAEKIGMLDRGPSLWLRRALGEGGNS